MGLAVGEGWGTLLLWIIREGKKLLFFGEKGARGRVEGGQKLFSEFYWEFFFILFFFIFQGGKNRDPPPFPQTNLCLPVFAFFFEVDSFLWGLFLFFPDFYFFAPNFF